MQRSPSGAVLAARTARAAPSGTPSSGTPSSGTASSGTASALDAGSDWQTAGPPAAGSGAPSEVTVDRIVEAIEERVLAEIERRGGRYSGMF